MKAQVALVECAEALLAEEYLSGMAALAALAGNPYDVRVRRFGATWAVVTPGARDGHLNHALLFSPADIAHLPALAQYYRSCGCRCWMETSWERFDAEVEAALAEHGFRPGSVCDVFIGPALSEMPPLPEGVQVQEIAGARRADLYDLWVEAFGQSWLPRDAWMAIHGLPEYRFFRATVDGGPAAVGCLYARGQEGILAWAATLECRRGRGAHAALIAARRAAAARMGCNTLLFEAEVDTPSARNAERAGFARLFRRRSWVQE